MQRSLIAASIANKYFTKILKENYTGNFYSQIRAYFNVQISYNFSYYIFFLFLKTIHFIQNKQN